MHLVYDVVSHSYDGGATTITEGCETPHEALGAAIEYAARMKIETLTLEPLREWLENPLRACSLADAGIRRIFSEGSRDEGKTYSTIWIEPRYGSVTPRSGDQYHAVARAI